MDSLDLNIPKGLSQIVAKLLEKKAEDRYQTAYGLYFDLITFRELWKQGKDEAFVIGESDASAHFQISQKFIWKRG